MTKEQEKYLKLLENKLNNILKEWNSLSDSKQLEGLVQDCWNKAKIKTNSMIYSDVNNFITAKENVSGYPRNFNWKILSAAVNNFVEENRASIIPKDTDLKPFISEIINNLDEKTVEEIQKNYEPIIKGSLSQVADFKRVFGE